MTTKTSLMMLIFILTLSIGVVNAQCIVGSVDTPGFAHDVFVVGDIAYVADYSNGLQIINVSDPTDPQIISEFSGPTSALGVFVKDDIAYVADDWQQTVYIINVANPGSPGLYNAYYTGGYPLDVFVKDNIAYIADGPGGLKIIGVSNPWSPNPLATYTPSGTFNSASGVFVKDNTAYLAYHYLSIAGYPSGGLDLVNVANPGAPGFMGAYTSIGHNLITPMRVFVKDNVAYLTDSAQDLAIIENPGPGGVLHSGLYTNWQLFVSGDYLFLPQTSESNLKIVDVSTPTSPTTIVDFPINSPIDVFVQGDYAYVAALGDGLKIINLKCAIPITDPCYAFIIPMQGGVFGGLSGADDICKNAAEDADWPSSATWHAWLSNSITDAADRIPHSTGGYYLPDGTTIADNWNDLTDGDIDHEIDQNMEGNLVDTSEYGWLAGVYTGTKSDGTYYGYDCDDWTNPWGVTIMGYITYTDQRWTDISSFIPLVTCEFEYGIYCFSCNANPPPHVEVEVEADGETYTGGITIPETIGPVT
ncbi:MAG: hypothetical protein JW778_08135, partial [Candidatus Altiarchaeota archaeon]|nr:hypothetical protein [Candidatus Altiarchaeota archaeon]